MKRIFLAVILMAAWGSVSFAAVRFVDPSSSTMKVDEGFNIPYIAEITTQEGAYFTQTHMEAITKIRLYFGSDEYTDSDICPTCFDYASFKASSRIIINVAGTNWTDSTRTATLFVYSAAYPLGLRVGSFSMISNGAFATAGASPATGIYLNDLSDVSTSGAQIGQYLKKTGVATYAFGTVSASGSMVYPGAGIPLSTGSAWGTPITNNSANWNTAYGWGDHALAGYVTGTPWTAMGYLTAITGSESAFTGWDKNASDDFTWDYDFGDLQNVPAYLLAETDPAFSAWLLATPPIYAEVDPAVGTHESTYDHTLIGTALQSESDPTVDTSAEIVAIIGSGVYQAPGSYLTSLSGAVLTDQSTPQTIGATGARLAMCWITDMTITNPINGSVTGNAGTVTNGVYTTGAGTVFLAPTGDGSALSGVLHAEVDGSTTNELQIASTLPVTTTAFAGLFSNDATSDTAQELFDLLDDHLHTGVYEPAFDFGTGAGDINTDDIPEGSTNKYEADTGTNTGDEPDASTSVKGVVELAESSEVTTGTSTSLSITPAALTGSESGMRYLAMVLFQRDQAVTVGDGGSGIPIAMDGYSIINVVATVDDKGITGTTDIQIRRRRAGTDVDVLTDPVTIGDEFFAQDETVNTANDDLQVGDIIYYDVNAVHSGTAPNGLSIVVVVQKL